MLTVWFGCSLATVPALCCQLLRVSWSTSTVMVVGWWVGIRVPRGRGCRLLLGGPLLPGIALALASVRLSCGFVETARSNERGIVLAGGGWRCDCVCECVVVRIVDHRPAAPPLLPDAYAHHAAFTVLTFMFPAVLTAVPFKQACEHGALGKPPELRLLETTNSLETSMVTRLTPLTRHRRAETDGGVQSMHSHVR